MYERKKKMNEEKEGKVWREREKKQEEKERDKRRVSMDRKVGERE